HHHHPHQFAYRAPPHHPTSTLSLHDALPIFLLGLLAIVSLSPHTRAQAVRVQGSVLGGNVAGGSWYLRDTPSYTGQPCYYIESKDRKSTRLNSSHSQISYAVVCSKKKNSRPG